MKEKIGKKRKGNGRELRERRNNEQKSAWTTSFTFHNVYCQFVYLNKIQQRKGQSKQH
jgi:hypothetical protein